MGIDQRIPRIAFFFHHMTVLPTESVERVNMYNCGMIRALEQGKK
jgi:hypothetical protein